MLAQVTEFAGLCDDGAMTTRLRTRTAAAVAISALLLTACGQNPEEEPPALGSDDATTAEASAEPTGATSNDAADDANDDAGDDASADGAGDDSAAAELPEVSADTCAAFEEFEDGFPGNTEADPEADAAWMEKQADAGDEQYTGQLKGLAEATRAYGEGHKPLTALEGQMRGLHEHCTHGG